jgi:hypothetical protein
MLRIPDMTPSNVKNEVVQWLGVAIAVLTVVVDALDAIDLTNWNTVVVTLFALLSTNAVSTQVSSKKTVAMVAAASQ